ncbi:MAG: efflux RND transporter periplasmic adaptor subunit [Bacteroidales bacterium]|nr:efflux RND transporter periplasmic adaptor subunit [Bacteroidales bacterium]
MKKIIILTLTIAALAACTPKERTTDVVSAEITKTQGKIGTLNVKLGELENELAALQSDKTTAGIKVNAKMFQRKDFASYFTSPATVEAVNAAMVSPEMNGRILKIHVDQGQKVSKGQVIVTLDGAVIRNSLAEMDKGLELSKTLYEKQKDLFDQNVGSEMQYLEAKNRYESLLKSRKSLMTQLDKTKIRAPFSGYVETIFLKVGEFATPGRQIIEVISLKDLYINTELSESYMSSVAEGDTVWVSFPNLPDFEKIATINQIGKVINPASRTFGIRINMENEAEKIKPNMLATLKIRDYKVSNALLIPTVYIRQDMEGSFLYVARPHDNDYFAQKVYVKTGHSDGINTIILDGLDDAALVVTNGFNHIKEDNQLDIVN